MNSSQDIVVDTLKSRYFELAATEDIGNTPAITAEVDKLESAIKELSSK